MKSLDQRLSYLLKKQVGGIKQVVGIMKFNWHFDRNPERIGKRFRTALAQNDAALRAKKSGSRQCEPGLEGATQDYLQQNDKLKAKNLKGLRIFAALSAAGMVKRPTRAVSHAVVTVVSLPRLALRFSGLRVLEWLRVRPRMMALVRTLLHGLPLVEGRLLAFAAGRPRSVALVNREWALDPDPDALAKWRRIFGLPNQ